MIQLYTIGFTRKSAARFFGLLATAGVTRLVDTRLKPGGQLAGFASSRDLPFFLARLNDCDYVHEPRLAPTPELLSDYRADHDWERYAARFAALMDERGIPGALDQAAFAASTSCLLCSEHEPTHCHRRLVAERMAARWGEIEIVHLV